MNWKGYRREWLRYYPGIHSQERWCPAEETGVPFELHVKRWFYWFNDQLHVAESFSRN
jgi:hypothetical protein